MALKVQGTTVVTDSRELQNIASIDTASAAIIQSALTISGGASVATTIAVPSSPSDGDLWWDSESTELFIYYDDGDSAQWVATTPASGIGSYGNPPLIAGRIDGFAPQNSSGSSMGAGFTATSTGTGLYTVTLNSGSFNSSTDYGITLNTEDSSQRVRILSRTTTSFSIEVTSGGSAANAHVSFAAYRGV